MDLSDFDETWPQCSSGINAPNFLRDLNEIRNIFVLTSRRVSTTEKIFHCPTSKWIFLVSNRNIEKASHTLLAQYVLSDLVQFV